MGTNPNGSPESMEDDPDHLLGVIWQCCNSRGRAIGCKRRGNGPETAEDRRMAKMRDIMKNGGLLTPQALGD